MKLIKINEANKTTRIGQIFLIISIILNVLCLLSKQYIESSMIAVVATTMVQSVIVSLISSVLLIVSTSYDFKMLKYLTLLSIFLLITREILWKGSTISILLYVLIVLSFFKSVKNKSIKIAVVVDCIVKTLLTVLYIFETISYYGKFYYSIPTIISILASLCISVGFYLVLVKISDKCMHK